MSWRFRGLAACLLTLLPLATAANAAPYFFDTKRAEVRFAYSLPLSSGKGRFTGVTGTAEVNDAAPEKGSVDVVIDTRTLKASDSLSEGELRGANFFAVSKYPKMHFKSRSIRGKSTTSYDLTGDMTVKGITRTITLHVELQPADKNGVRQMRAITRIKRSEFDMTAFGLLVGDLVQIEIRSPLVPAHSRKPTAKSDP
jgi:polyisoprenoid-binding protein YceI